MKTRLLILSALLLIVCNTFARQWNNNGTTVKLATTSNYVGIGLTTATEKLHVSGNILGTGSITGVTINGTTFVGNAFQNTASGNLSFSTNSMARLTILHSSGYVGIGQTTPLERLHLGGSIRGDQSGAIRINSGTGTVDIGAKTTSYGNIDTDRPSFLFNKKIFIDEGIISSYDEPLTLQTAGTTALTILTNGNVGIGTSLATNPYKLAVNGKIGAKEVQVETTSAAWPDYVFNAGYQLMPLTLLESYIQSHKHLPEVPSATEIETTGHKLGEMDAVLLKKVEELTLYLIELKKENDALQARVKDLEEKRD